MKKVAIISAFLLAGIAGAYADTYTYTITVTNTQPITYSDALPVSGFLDKIEVWADAASTSTVTVATYSSGNQAIDTYYTATISATTTSATSVARTRVIGTDNGATALTAAAFAIPAGVSTNGVGTILTAAYERPMIGSNLKVAVTGTKNDGSCPVIVTIFYEPIRH